MGEEERPVRLLCLNMLASESMKLNKLRRHLKTLHLNHADKPLGFFSTSLSFLFTLMILKILCYAEVYL